MFDPTYDCYGSMAKRAGGLVKAVKLNIQDWSVDRDELRQAFSPKTKLIIVNTPHNPTGKIFSKHDLQFIADLCIQHNTYALLDEVHSPRCCVNCLHQLCCVVCLALQEMLTEVVCVLLPTGVRTFSV